MKDVAAHLLDGNIRMVSVLRDDYTGDPPGSIHSYRDLVDYLNRLNADWVQAMKRVSPSLLTGLLEQTGPWFTNCMESLDPFAPSRFPVDWAGESESMNWFHTAREYTEKWHHQQQIREAVGKPGILSRELYFPVLDTFMRALPHTYRDVTAPNTTRVRVTVSGDAGGRWEIVRDQNRWIRTAPSGVARAEVTIDTETSWQLFTKGMSADEARGRIEVAGDADLGRHVLNMVSVMA